MPATGGEQRKQAGNQERDPDDAEHPGGSGVPAARVHQQGSKTDPRHRGDMSGEAKSAGGELRTAEEPWQILTPEQPGEDVLLAEHRMRDGNGDCEEGGGVEGWRHGRRVPRAWSELGWNDLWLQGV